MTSYERFGEFYDAVIGDRRAAAEQVLELIRAAKPDAKNVLELGCGTGSILKRLQDAYEVSGLEYPLTLRPNYRASLQCVFQREDNDTKRGHFYRVNDGDISIEL